MLITSCLGLLLGIIFSHELWFPFTRTFPRVPFVFESPGLVDRILTVILAISFIALIFWQHKITFIITISSLLLLIFFDQMRLQPWVYQYFLLLMVMFLRPEDESNRTLGLAQLLLAGLYFWSGLQKFNFTFSHETLPKLVEPFQNFLPENLVFLGLGIAIIEILVGIGLLFRKTRNLAVGLAAVMHSVILILLIAKNYNHIVWIWNVILIVLVVIAFWRNEASFGQMMKNGVWKIKSAEMITILSLFLPILSFFGFWDMYLSGALYSGNVKVGVIRISDEVFQKLSPTAQKVVFRTKTNNEQILPFHEWSMNELNVPVYPEERVFRQVTLQVCKLTSDKTQIELVIRKRPAILDGTYQIKRLSCIELEN